jgi:hypothetical protein
MEGQYPAITLMIGITIPIMASAMAPLQAQLLPLKRPNATMNDPMPIARIMEPQIAKYCAVASTKPGTAVFIGRTDARKAAKPNESRPVKRANNPLINNIMPSQSTPGGFVLNTSLQDDTLVFSKYAR